MPNRYRKLATVSAMLGWFALALQLILTIGLTMAKGGSALAGLWLWLGYFTITTNLLAAIALTAVAIGPRGPISRFSGRPDVHGMLAMSMLIVGLIYNLLLRQLWHPQGWQLIADMLLHDVMPLLFLLHWWLAVSKATLHWRQLGGWLLYPAGYLAYALARGAASDWYPYPFLDVVALGYARVLVNACMVVLAFVALGLLLIALGRWQARRTAARAARPAPSGQS